MSLRVQPLVERLDEVIHKGTILGTLFFHEAHGLLVCGLHFGIPLLALLAYLLVVFRVQLSAVRRDE